VSCAVAEMGAAKDSVLTNAAAVKNIFFILIDCYLYFTMHLLKSFIFAPLREINNSATSQRNGITASYVLNYAIFSVLCPLAGEVIH
jgi:hypothetical protein